MDSGLNNKTLNIIVLTATLVQGISALFAIFDYVNSKASFLGSEVFSPRVTILSSGFTILVVALLLIGQRNRLTKAQSLLLATVFLFGLFILGYSVGIWKGESRTTLDLKSITTGGDLPLMQFKTFGFEGGLDGWTLNKLTAPTTINLEFNADEAYKGNGYVRFRTDMPGSLDEGVTFEKALVFIYSDVDLLKYANTMTAHVRIVPSEQTVDNKFFVELQGGAKQDDSYYANFRYSLTPGEWTPVIWAYPSNVFIKNSEQIHFPDAPSVVSFFIWSEKPFVGYVEIDEISFYFVEQP